MVPGITGSRGKWLAKTQAIEDNSFLATAYPRPNLPPSMLISMILSNASSGGLGSFGVFSPNKVPSLQRINSERRNERFPYWFLSSHCHSEAVTNDSDTTH